VSQCSQNNIEISPVGKAAQLHFLFFVLIHHEHHMPAQGAEKEIQGTQPALAPSPDALERFDWLPCQLSLQIPVSEFTLGDLLRMQVGTVVGTAVRSTEEIPLSVNGQLIAWIQFEMIGERLAARITELA